MVYIQINAMLYSDEKKQIPPAPLCEFTQLTAGVLTVYTTGQEISSTTGSYPMGTLVARGCLDTPT